jgi:RNA polymerase sigma-70 factor (ECF subfamily)
MSERNGSFLSEHEESEEQDLRLMVRIQNGDTSALNELMQRYEPGLIHFLNRKFPEQEDVKDVLQDAWTLVLRKSYQFDPARQVRPWIYTVVSHVALDLIRKKSRHPTLLVDFQMHDPEKDAEQFDIEDTRLPENPPLEIRELVEIVHRCITTGLSQSHSEITRLAFIEHLKYREIADVLGIPIGTVKSRLKTARERLIEQLNDYKIAELLS